MSEFTGIDLSQIPAPDIVESLDFELILGEMKEALAVELGDRSWDLPSDPLVKLLEVCAYREVLLRQRVNEAAKQTMLAYATGTNLQHLSALWGVSKQDGESDDRLRSRTQLALEGFSTAGAIGAYVYHSLAADSRVKDVAVSSPSPGQVLVSILSSVGDGLASSDLLSAVSSHLNNEDVRPLTDQVIVQSAQIVPYSVQATLIFYPGPDAATVRQSAERALQAYVLEHHAMGHDITLSGIYAALHQPGVQNVSLSSPAQSVVCSTHQAAYCSSINLIEGSRDE